MAGLKTGASSMLTRCDPQIGHPTVLVSLASALGDDLGLGSLALLHCRSTMPASLEGRPSSVLPQINSY